MNTRRKVAASVKKPLRECSLPELRVFLRETENVTTIGEDGQNPDKMSLKQLVAAMEEAGYKDVYVSPEPDEQNASFDARMSQMYREMQNVGLADDAEHWFKIRIENAQNINGKSKNVPIPVCFNDDMGYIPRGVPVWVRGRFVHCLEEATETHTIQTDITAKFSEGSRREEGMRYPYKVLEVAGLVKDGLPQIRDGEQIIYADRHAKVARQRLDQVVGRQAA